MPVMTFVGFVGFVLVFISIFLLKIVDYGCHGRTFIIFRHEGGFALGLGNQDSKDVVELLFPEKCGHGGNSKELLLVGIILGSLDSIHHSILICVPAVGTAFHQLVADQCFPLMAACRAYSLMSDVQLISSSNCPRIVSTSSSVSKGGRRNSYCASAMLTLARYRQSALALQNWHHSPQ